MSNIQMFSVIGVLSFASVQAFSQTHDPHAGMHHGTSSQKTAQTGTNAQSELMVSMDKMHKDMMDESKLTGDPDKDFLQMMIPHHQGAIDMAEIVIKNGKDPRVKKLAKEIISAQKKEIDQMRSWIGEIEKDRAKSKR